MFFVAYLVLGSTVSYDILIRFVVRFAKHFQ
jgi:hypothetical protein